MAQKGQQDPYAHCNTSIFIKKLLSERPLTSFHFLNLFSALMKNLVTSFLFLLTLATWGGLVKQERIG